MKRIQNTVATHQLWSRKESFIVAVSGGPDSLCLLDALFLLSQKYDFALHVVHVNYSLRGKDSALDEALVKKQSAAYGLALTVLHPRKTSSTNLEEKLRDIRYQFFERVRAQKKATLIAVAHHRDDQAETFLLRLFRGSGMRGLSAMRPKNGVVVRPLIDMSRKDILHYLEERSIPYRLDKSNADPRFLRNRLRNDLIPLIENQYQPHIKKLLADTATLLASDYALLESLPTPFLEENNGTLEFSASTILTYPEALLKRKFRAFLRPYYREKSPPKGVVDELLKILRSTKNKHQSFTFQGLKVERKGDTVRLLRFQR